MKKLIIIPALLLMCLPPFVVFAENFTVRGDMDAAIRYELQHQINTGDAMRKLMLSFVAPQSFASPTYRQQISNLKIDFSPRADEQNTSTDERGNNIIEATWYNVPKVVEATVSFDARTQTGLNPISSKAPFPVAPVPGHLKAFLGASEQVQTQDPAIRDLARKLTRDAKTQFDAVQKVVSWVVDHVHYVNPPVQYDALYSLRTGKGNCQNYSHLTAALLRQVGIPVRIVNGVTLNAPLDVAWEKGVLTFKMGQGRHSWVEVWFPDTGWVPYDPQNMQFFISSRFVRIEIGVDNNETKNDGLVRWVQSSEARVQPTLQETIGANFLSDSSKVTAQRESYGPKNLLLGPAVVAMAKEPPPPVLKPEPPVPQPEPAPAPVVIPPKPEPMPEPKPEPKPAPPTVAEPTKPEPKPLPVPAPLPPSPAPAPSETKPPVKVPPEIKKPLRFNVPFVYGNLSFPENLDFAFPRKTKAKGKNAFEMSRNFLVETAEFVTHSVTQYAQVVELKKPVRLSAIALALHNFGGEGHLWVDVFKDEGGQPGEPLFTTQLIALEEISTKPGYRWQIFKFADKERPTLAPGAYWIALGFSGQPVVNWFYTYGKPVGPVYGTRYKSIFESQWSGALNYEFNYKLMGMTVK